MARSRTRAPLSTTTTVTKTQTVRINGARVKISTKSGNVTTKPALPLEWELQAAQVSALRRLPQYQRQFLLAGDMNASKRGPMAQAQAIATGITSGEPDLRIYGEFGRLLMIENKVGQGGLSPAQKDRQAALQRLGYPAQLIAHWLPTSINRFLLSISCQVWLCFASIPAPSCDCCPTAMRKLSLLLPKTQLRGLKRRWKVSTDKTCSKLMTTSCLFLSRNSPRITLPMFSSTAY